MFSQLALLILACTTCLCTAQARTQERDRDILSRCPDIGKPFYDSPSFVTTPTEDISDQTLATYYQRVVTGLNCLEIEFGAGPDGDRRGPFATMYGLVSREVFALTFPEIPLMWRSWDNSTQTWSKTEVPYQRMAYAQKCYPTWSSPPGGRFNVHLGVVFAEYYRIAIAEYLSDGKLPPLWGDDFLIEINRAKLPAILVSAFIGMGIHINHDLGMAYISLAPIIKSWDDDSLWGRAHLDIDGLLGCLSPPTFQYFDNLYKRPKAINGIEDTVSLEDQIGRLNALCSKFGISGCFHFIDQNVINEFRSFAWSSAVRYHECSGIGVCQDLVVDSMIAATKGLTELLSVAPHCPNLGGTGASIVTKFLCKEVFQQS